MTKNSFYSVNLIGRLEFARLIGSLLFLLPILIIFDKFYYFLLISLHIIFITQFIRRVTFYEDGIYITFLFRIIKRKTEVDYNQLIKVIYKFGQPRGYPTIIFKKHRTKFIHKLFDFLTYRFIVYDINKAIEILCFFKQKGVKVELETYPCEAKNQILKALSQC